MEGIECQTCQLAFLKDIQPPKQQRGDIEYIPSIVAGVSEDFVSSTSSQNSSDGSRSNWHRPWQCCAHQEGSHANNGLNNPRGS